MKPLVNDWKTAALESVHDALPPLEELDAWIDRVFDSENWERSAAERLMKSVFPGLDLASLENGISSSQLGGLLGQMRAFLNQADSVTGVIDVHLERVRTNGEKIEELAKNCSETCPEEERERVGQLLAFASAVSDSLTLFADFRDEIPAIKTALSDSISEVLKTASDQTGPEIAGFMSAFGKAWASPSIDDQGRIVTGNPLTVNVTAILVVLGPAMKEHFSSLTEVHRLLARALPNQLTRDENSLEWLEQRKAIEAICRSHGFKLRGRGRPKKENPKTQ